MVKRTITSFDDDALEGYDCVVNCTGFGAKRLCSDINLVPIRGQVFKVEFCSNLSSIFMYNSLFVV